MTREHKLALIVGFSLILLVAILISDHLSRARRTRVDEVRPSEVLLAERSLNPSDPLAPLSPPARVEEPEPTGPASAAPMQAVPGTRADTGATPAPAAFHADSPMAAAPPRTAATGQPGPSIERARAEGVLVPVLPPTTSLGTAVTDPVVTETAPSEALPPPSEVRYHAVQKGDTLYRLAEKYYGSGSQWKRLADANRDRLSGGGVLREGTRLKIPAPFAGAAERPAPDKPATPKQSPSKPPEIRTATAKTYTVRSGDTLGTISRKALGTSRRWREILSLNGLDEEEFLTPGMVLKLPG